MPTPLNQNQQTHAITAALKQHKKSQNKERKNKASEHP
jgi:hypothetical protein